MALKTRNAGILGWTVAGVVAGSLALAAPAQAQTTTKKPKAGAAVSVSASASAGGALDRQQLADAKKHYGDGDTKFKAGDFAGALADFQAADAIKATPQTARFIGLCQDNLGHFHEAMDAYQRFLSNVPPKMAAQGDEIKARVAAIQALPGKLHLTSDPSAAGISIDTKPQSNPTPTDVEVPPGHHTIHFSAQGHDPVDKDVDVAYASKQDVNVTLPVSALPPPVVVAPPPVVTPVAEPVAADKPPQHHSNVAAWITGGAAVVAVGIGTGFGIAALNDKSNFNNHPTTATADSGENHALIADMAFGVAVTLGVTSAVLFLSHDDPPAGAPPPAASTGSAGPTRKAAEVASAETPAPVAKARPAFTITAAPYATPHGAGAGALIRF